MTTGSRRTAVRVVLAMTLGVVLSVLVQGAESARVDAPTASAALPPLDSFPARVSSNGRYVLDQQGRPYLINGDAAWSVVAELDRDDAVRYLDDRRSKGFNVVLASVVEHNFASDAPRNAAGDAPFTGSPFASPNEAYFAHLDWLVGAAQARGITLMLVPAYLGYNGGDEGWYSEVTAAGTSTMRSYGVYLGSRYRDFPNIIWAVGGDYNPPAAGRAAMNALAEGIRSADPDHLMTAHTGPESTADGVWGSSSWLDLDNVYTYGSPADATAAAYANTPTRPLFFMEGIYENEQGVDDSFMRTQAWVSMLSGATGHIFGNNPIWHFGSGGLYSTQLTWQQALDGPGSRGMMFLRALFDGIPWYRLTPDRSDRFLVGGEQRQNDRAAAAISAADGLAVVYVPTRRTITVDLGALSGATVRLRWYDPAGGSMRTIGTRSTSGTADLTTPGVNSGGDQDWVLIVDAGGVVPPEVSGGPSRLLDTRPGGTTIDGRSSKLGRRSAGSTTKVQIAGRGNIPTGAATAIVNLTVAQPSGSGYATVYPCDQPLPNASNINYVPGQNIANNVITDLATNGTICIYTSAATHLIIDAAGSFPSTTQLAAITPIRLLDTRPGGTTIDGRSSKLGRRSAGSTTKVQIAGRGKIPTGAATAIVNLTVAQPSGSGYATVYPCDQPLPNASNINYVPGQNIANNVITDLATNGTICIYTSAATHLIIDAAGSFPSTTQLDAITPIRLLDTRPGGTTIDGRSSKLGRRSAGSTTKVQIAGRGKIPTGAATAIVNLTVAQPSGSGYATVYPCDQPLPNASNINYVPGQNIANNVITDLATNGTICIYTSAATHLIIDAAGSYG